jgi:hypothetical protein
MNMNMGMGRHGLIQRNFSLGHGIYLISGFRKEIEIMRDENV